MLATRFGRELSSNLDENLPKEGILDSLTICDQLAEQCCKRQATLKCWNVDTTALACSEPLRLCVFA
jgi:hypothetical protein